MQHVLVQQMEKRAEVLAVVKERILTTNSCSVSQTQKQQCTFQGVLRLLGLLGSSVKVLSGAEVNTVQLDCDVSLEIPSGTVVAYSILELEIKKTGHYGKSVTFECLCWRGKWSTKLVSSLHFGLFSLNMCTDEAKKEKRSVFYLC